MCIIGSQGFLASNLTQLLLNEGYKVTGIGSKQCDLTKIGASADLAKMLPVDAVVILTSTITPDRGKDTSVIFKNLLMGENVFLALENSRIKHFVYISSDAVYSDLEKINETTPCEPSTLYGCGHIFREKLFGDQARRKGWPLTIVRPVAVFGPGDTHNSYGPNRFLRSAITHSEIALFGKGEEIRHHIFINDLCRLFSRIISERWVGVLNGAFNPPLSFMQLARTIQQVCDEHTKIHYLPRHIAIKHKRLDTTKLAQAFPDLLPTPLDEALRITYASFKQKM